MTFPKIQLCADTQGHNTVQRMIFASYFSDEWSIEPSDAVPQMEIYRLKGSELRIALMLGLEPGTSNIVGAYVLFRSQDDSMNIECSCILEHIEAVVESAIMTTRNANISHQKFIDNLRIWYATKTRRTVSGSAAAAAAASMGTANIENIPPQELK